LNHKRLIFSRSSDLRKTFTSDAALHVINKASVDELERRVRQNHPGGLKDFYVSTEQFRPNIVLNTKKSF